MKNEYSCIEMRSTVRCVIQARGMCSLLWRCFSLKSKFNWPYIRLGLDLCTIAQKDVKFRLRKAPM